MRVKLFPILLLAILSGCSKDEPNAFSIDKGAVEETVSISNTGIDIGIGDIESNMRLYVLIDESSSSDTVTHSEEFTKLEWLARASIDVSTPYPQELNLMVFNRSVKSFPGHAYRTTVNLYCEDKIIDTFKYITGKNALLDIKEHVVDVMPDLNPEAGKSILLHVRAEIEFFPNTDDESITVDTPAAASVTRTTKMGNPLRITFGT